MVKKYAIIRNINHKDNFGYTPLELAKLIGNEKIMKVLSNV